MITFMLKTMFWKYSWTHFFRNWKIVFQMYQTTRKLAFYSEEVALIQRNAA